MHEPLPGRWDPGPGLEPRCGRKRRRWERGHCRHRAGSGTGPGPRNICAHRRHRELDRQGQGPARGQVSGGSLQGRRLCGCRHPHPAAGRDRLPGRALPRQGQRGEADCAHRAHGRGHGETQRLAARSVHPDRGEWLFLRARHLGRQTRGSAPHGDVPAAQGRGLRADARSHHRIQRRRGDGAGHGTRPRDCASGSGGRRIRPQRRRRRRRARRGQRQTAHFLRARRREEFR